ncbi:MAG: prolipoprotein diacylglyceryl transferase [Pseudomonadota bacterium]
MNDLFVVVLGVILAGMMIWGFRFLPEERWQMLAAIPLRKHENGSWSGLNLTFYGMLSAVAYAAALAILILLMGSSGIELPLLCLPTIPVLLVAVPSAKILARIIEKKKGTFTVGGASFAAILVIPWIAAGINTLFDQHLDVMVFLAAFSIAYTFGEALGRLACISFGCCYGKPLDECGRITNIIFSRFNFVFIGKTKKIAYASGMDGRKMIPIQAVTSVLYAGAGLAGTGLFLHGHFRSALMITIAVTQVWRVISEFFRADFRGTWGFSAYQIMALISVFYMAAIVIAAPAKESMALPDISMGLSSLWQPGSLLMVQGFWLMAFLYTGRSVVTGSSIRFHVISEII